MLIPSICTYTHTRHEIGNWKPQGFSYLFKFFSYGAHITVIIVITSYKINTHSTPDLLRSRAGFKGREART